MFAYRYVFVYVLCAGSWCVEQRIDERWTTSTLTSLRQKQICSGLTPVKQLARTGVETSCPLWTREAFHSLDEHSWDASAPTNSAWHLPNATDRRRLPAIFDVFDERARTICVPNKYFRVGAVNSVRAADDQRDAYPAIWRRVRATLWRKCAWMGNLLDYVGDLMTTDLVQYSANCMRCQQTGRHFSCSKFLNTHYHASICMTG